MAVPQHHVADFVDMPIVGASLGKDHDLVLVPFLLLLRQFFEQTMLFPGLQRVADGLVQRLQRVGGGQGLAKLLEMLFLFCRRGGRGRGRGGGKKLLPNSVVQLGQRLHLEHPRDFVHQPRLQLYQRLTVLLVHRADFALGPFAGFQGAAAARAS